MTADQLLFGLAARGVELWYEGDRLRFRAPKGALELEQRENLATNRQGMLDLLRAEGAALHSRKLRAFDEPPFR